MKSTPAAVGNGRSNKKSNNRFGAGFSASSMKRELSRQGAAQDKGVLRRGRSGARLEIKAEPDAAGWGLNPVSGGGIVQFAQLVPQVQRVAMVDRRLENAIARC
ncbi:MAG: hypothetical protein NTW86_33105 [Candidatus Sumerlaeota bacterium]|nr:hypothetical protein [Candidatus Sumerlaeota bacterium]